MLIHACKKWFLLLALLFTTHHAAAAEPISREFLAKLIRTHASQDPHLLEYLSRCPVENYEIVQSPSLGRYWIEKNSQDMIKQVIREGWHREYHVFRPLIDHVRPGSVVIDIGAHIGTHTMGLAWAVGAGVVHAFEPQLKIFTELLVNAELNDKYNIIFHRMALGNAHQWVNMNSSCPSNEGGVSVGEGGDPVEMMRLDDFYLQNVSVIKIDVEGLEMEVLAGAAETIQRNRPVMLVEIMGHVEYRSADPSTKQAIEERIHVIENMGYKVTYLGSSDFLCEPK